MNSSNNNDGRLGRKISRRTFVAGAAAATAFSIAPSSALGATPANDKVNVAVIGVGGQGTVNLRNLLGLDDVEIVALCDVNQQADYSRFYYGGVAGLAPALKVVEEAYADRSKSGSYKGCASYGDYNEMLDSESGIDAVLIATPDHVHSVAAMAAIKKRKHVYCEKPLTRSIYETRMVAEAARKAGVASQMGNQGHSGEGIRLTVEWIRDGAIGPIREVHGWTGAGGGEWTGLDTRPEGDMPVPEGLDWDRWLGPAAYRPYNLAYAPYNWRGWWDFGTGGIGDMACHNLDPAFWALDLGSPETVEASAVRLNDETVPSGALYHYEFGARGDRPPVTLKWYDGGLMPPRPRELEEGRRMGDDGVYFVGDDGVIMCGGWGGVPRIIPESKMKAYSRPEKSIKRVEGHHRDWIDACKGGDPASGNFDYSGPLTEMVLVGNVALRAGKRIHYDGANLKATNAPEADEYIRPKFREGWSL
jgi:predicted dehydrogenase